MVEGRLDNADLKDLGADVNASVLPTLTLAYRSKWTNLII